MSTNASAQAPQQRPSRPGPAQVSPHDSSSAVAVAFLTTVAIAAIVLLIFGAGERGTALALRTTARFAFLLFWPAYAGGALAKLAGPRFGALARHARAFGLAFAAAMSVHVGLVLWRFQIATEPSDSMVFFWAAILCTWLLAVLSLPQLRDALGPRIWRTFRNLTMEYIAVVFAADFILDPLREGGLHAYPLTYLPFSGALLAAACLRIAAFARYDGRGNPARQP